MLAKSRLHKHLTAGFTGGLACLACACAPPKARHIPSTVASAVQAPLLQTRELVLPARRPDALSGQAFVERTLPLTGGEREQLFLEQVATGNVPPFLRTLAPVEWTEAGHTLVIFVTRDYFSIGSDEDFLRYPPTKWSAHKIAKQLNAVLPTRRMVDAIYAQGKHLSSPRYPPSSEMTGIRFFAMHHRDIESRRNELTIPLTALVAGHKKDLVTSARERDEPDRLAIYGWFRKSGDIVQSLSLVHAGNYSDYTHGLRLVDRRALLDGREVDVLDLLANASTASLVSDEGRFKAVGYGSP